MIQTLISLVILLVAGVVLLAFVALAATLVLFLS
jgi:hypothetical protein